DILGDRRAASPLAPAQDCIILSPFRHPRGRRGRHDWKTIVFAALACGVCRGCSPRPCWLRAAHAAQLDPARMSADTIRALEQRLTDAGCYKGAIDGKTGEALDAAIKACPARRTPPVASTPPAPSSRPPPTTRPSGSGPCPTAG